MTISPKELINDSQHRFFNVWVIASYIVLSSLQDQLIHKASSQYHILFTKGNSVVSTLRGNEHKAIPNEREFVGCSLQESF